MYSAVPSLEGYSTLPIDAFLVLRSLNLVSRSLKSPWQCSLTTMPPVVPPQLAPNPPQRRAGAINLGPFQPGPGHGPILKCVLRWRESSADVPRSYVAASIRTDVIKLHPLLACEMYDPNVSLLTLARTRMDH